MEATLNVNMDADEAGMSSQLYYMLVMICKSSALTRVVNAGPGEGLEAWRSLVLYHEPSSQMRSAGLLLELLAYDFEGDVSGKLVAFERDIFRYEQSSKEKFPDSIKIGTLLRRLPEGPVRQHLLLNSARLTGWASMRDEVENLRRAQLASASGPMPMDVSALEGEMAAFNVKGKGGKSGKGKGFTKNYGAKDSAQSDACGVCGKMGHWKKGCWYNVPVYGKGKSKGKGKQKPTKGKGKGASGERKCWNCGETGHMSSECKKPKKDVNSLGGQGSNGEPESHEPESHDALGGLSLSSVERNNEYGRKDVTRVSFGIDSGAAATTLPQDWCTDYPLEKVGIGKGYYSASGEAIPDLGLRRLVVTTAGSVKAVRARVTKVRRALISVYDMCRTGHRVVFDMEDGVDMSYVVHKKTGQTIKPVLRSRTWDLDVEVVPYAESTVVLEKIAKESSGQLAPFQRQAPRL